MKTKALVVAVSTAILGACASQPEKIQSASVSTLQYENYNCNQIAAELGRVNERAAALHSSLKKKADDDTAQMAVGLILLWPTLFFLEGGDGPEAAEYSKLKGEREALEKTAIQKQCGIQTATPAATESPSRSSADSAAAGTPTTGLPPDTATTPMAAPAATGAKSGRYWLNAAQFGRTLDCDPTAPPQLITETSDAEIYQLACKEKPMPLVVKCTIEQCGGV